MARNCCETGAHVCCIIPPRILKAISESPDNDDETKAAAQETLEHTLDILERRRRRGGHQNGQGIVPDSILGHMATSEHVSSEDRESAQATLSQSQETRDRRAGRQRYETGDEEESAVIRDIYNANHTKSFQKLPGTLIRKEDQPASKSSDDDANACYENFGYTYDFYLKILNRESVDDKNMPLVGSVHFAVRYANAFWDGEQMVFGDGNNFLYKFCQSLDVIGHELTHGVTQNTCALEYHTQSGALNESISDVFGSLVKQYTAGETAEEADWLIGEGCLFPGVRGVALRSMKAPGTAYNDPRVGKDDQPATMDHYHDVPDDRDNDWGGVHANSGIPNHAFYLAAIGFGGYAWEKAGKIWYGTITSGKVPTDCDFAKFADVTISVANEMFGEDAGGIVRKAWEGVKVL